MREFKNILVVRTDRIGDVILTTPCFKALRRAYPQARISVLVAPATRELLVGNPDSFVSWFLKSVQLVLIQHIVHEVISLVDLIYPTVFLN